MPKFSKQTIAQTFKFDCERFLRFSLISDNENNLLKHNHSIDVKDVQLGRMRPGVQLMTASANKWEVDKYQDLIDCNDDSSNDQILFELEPNVNSQLGRRAFSTVNEERLLKSLNEIKPPSYIIEGIYEVPATLSNGLVEAKLKHNIDLSRANPDIIWIRPYPTGSPLINTTTNIPEYELHIIDVKLASEASLKHFTEVTFYALSLAEKLHQLGLDKKYRVSAKGLIFPGSHDNNAFKNIYKDLKANGSSDPLKQALLQTLKEVPYEIYSIHVKEFLDNTLLKVLNKKPLETNWHVSPKCQLCQFLDICKKQADATDHLSMLPWLSQGQANLIRSFGINTLNELYEAIINNWPEWEKIKNSSNQLKADELAIIARTKALIHKGPELITQRKYSSMPAYTDMSIYLTIHFDPGTGLTFAMAAKRVYFKSNFFNHQLTTVQQAPVINENTFIIDKVDNFRPDTEKRRLIEFLDCINSWLEEAQKANQDIHNQRQMDGTRDSAYQKIKVHFYFWSQLEVTQLLRMLHRHMDSPEVAEKIGLIIRLFPPQRTLPSDTDAFRSQPGTVVKDVYKRLVGLPLPYDYNLFDVANTFYPNLKTNGEPFQYFIPHGFSTPMNDQIPFERAYELWKDNVMLIKGGQKYTRDELYDTLKSVLKLHLSALQEVTNKIIDKSRSQLTLIKPAFSAERLSTPRLPERANKLLIFQKLDAIVQDIQYIHTMSLPVLEREAKFMCVRGLTPATGSEYDNELSSIQQLPEYINSELRIFTFLPSSKDAKFREGDFMLVLSNEDDDLQFNIPWYKQLGLSFYEAQDIWDRQTFSADKHTSAVYSKVGDLLQVKLVRLSTNRIIPYLVVEINDIDLFNFAIDLELISVNKQFVLDKIHKDFDTDAYSKVLKMVGGSSAKSKKTKTNGKK